MRTWRYLSIPTIAATAISAALVIPVFAPRAGAATAPDASAVGKASQALLRLGDMPKGWTSSKSSATNSQFPGAAQLAHCIGVPLSVLVSNPPTANSPDFSSKSHLLTVDDSVAIDPSDAAAQADYASLANPKTPACLTTALNGPAKAELDMSLGSGTKVGKVVVTRAPATDFAAHGANFTASMPVTSQGTTITLDLTVVDYVQGDEEQTVTLISVLSAFPVSLAHQLTTIAAGRL